MSTTHKQDCKARHYKQAAVKEVEVSTVRHWDNPAWCVRCMSCIAVQVSTCAVCPDSLAALL